jgi:hypothetical protein
MTFETHCINGARQFLQTALVIDDRAELGFVTPDSTEPKVAVQAEKAAFRRSRKEKSATEGEGSEPDPRQGGGAGESESIAPSESVLNSPESTAVNANAEPGSGVDDNLVRNEASAAQLNAKALTDAFLKAEVICGVHKPIKGDDSVALAVKAAKRADIVVVDWYLEDHSSTKAKAIIAGVLKSDVEEHGRLRLIAIYTSEPGRTMVAKELLDALEKDQRLVGCLSLDGAALRSTDTRICIFNKEGTLQTGDVLTVPEAELPEHLLREFAKLTDGLLANFAVSAVAAVRRGAHHVLARFPKELDGVYLAHRISLRNPEEAEDMALERVTAELSNLVENADVPGRTLPVAVIDAWLDDRARQGRVFKNANARLPIELMKELVRGGIARLKDKSGQKQVEGEEPATPNSAVSHKSIIDVFYPSISDARAAACNFARLTSYKREVGRVRLDGFKPRLTLGTLLKVRRDLADRGLYDEIDGQFLLCVQPRCDSVRITGPRAFPFQQAKYDKDSFNLIVDEKGPSGYLQLDTKPMATIMLKFRPEAQSQPIFARKDGAAYLFTDDRGRVFEWIGDLDDLKAQRFASDLGANMHRVGIDEFEWLRLGSAGEIKPEQQVPVAPASGGSGKREGGKLPAG